MVRRTRHWMDWQPGPAPSLMEHDPSGRGLPIRLVSLHGLRTPRRSLARAHRRAAAALLPLRKPELRAADRMVGREAARERRRSCRGPAEAIR